MKRQALSKLTARCTRVNKSGLLLVASVLLLLSGQALADDCLKDDTGLNNPACTAGDVTIALVTSPADVACEIGQVVELDLTVRFEANAVTRYDVGAYFATGDNDAKASGGSCQKEYLQPPLESGGNPFDPDGGPWRDEDGDLCGDILEADGINIGYIDDFQYTCRDGDNDGKADIGTCTFWDNNDKDVCESASDAKPGTGAKCRCELIAIGNVFIAGKIVVDKVTVPGGSTVDFTFNPTGFNGDASFMLNDGDSPFNSLPLVPTANGGGPYAIAEATPPAGWQHVPGTDVSCVGDDGAENPAAIDLGSGETVTCTFTNHEICPTSNDCSGFDTDCGYKVCDPTGTVNNCDTQMYLSATTECRAASGVCDVAESCSGSSADCPADGFAAATTECRAASGLCDVAESCTGSGADCPADGYAAATTECRAASGVCDVAESCSGSSADCPVDGFAAATTECRAASGVCDVAESCTGSGADCPVDGFTAATTECRAANGVCDVAESCTGSGADCPVDGFAAATTECRASNGVCDVAESCTGSGADCPADGYAAATTECRAASGLCDVAESCTGSGADCPVDGFAAATTECRAANGVCDVAESCTGSSADCPVDGFAAATTECRAANGVCDVAESCTGSGADCPIDGFVSAGTECRAAENECDEAEECTGSAAECPAANPTPVCEFYAGCSPGFWRNHTELWDGGLDDLTGSIKTGDTWSGTLGISSCAGKTNLGTMTFGDTIAKSGGKTNNTLFHFTSCLLNSDYLNNAYPGSFPAAGLPSYLGNLGTLATYMANACADPDGASPTLNELTEACKYGNDHDEIITFCPFDSTPDPFSNL